MSESLIEAVMRHTESHAGADGFKTAIEGLTLLRSPHETRPRYRIYKPALCIVLQGAKWTTFGDRRIGYGAGQALVVSIELPALGRVEEASPDKPYLGMTVELDIGIMRDVMAMLNPPPQAPAMVSSGMFVVEFEGSLVDCVRRIIRLLDTPDAIPALYPLIMREICYWLLTGPNGGEVASTVLANNHTHSVIHAIHALRDQFERPIRIDELAGRANMSPSAFHRQFKQVTSMTPLQYQKHLRLLEARRLMLTDAVNAETAAYQVGYESASQFSREYTRMFGCPPRRDIIRLHERVLAPSALSGTAST